VEAKRWDIKSNKLESRDFRPLYSVTMNKIVSRVSRYEFHSETNIHENYRGIKAIGIMAQENKIEANTECFCRVRKEISKQAEHSQVLVRKSKLILRQVRYLPKKYKLEDYKRCRNRCS
jgi:hypothetical protein